MDALFSSDTLIELISLIHFLTGTHTVLDKNVSKRENSNGTQSQKEVKSKENQ